MNPVDCIKSYIKKHSLSQAAFGKQVGVSQGMVWQWLNQQRPIGAKVAKRIDENTGGEIKKEKLRPDIFE